MRTFNFPTDTISFGKHRSKTIAWIIDNDKSYYLWLINNNFKQTKLISDYANGIDNIKSEIKWSVSSKNDILEITKRYYYKLEAEKGLNKAKQRFAALSRFKRILN